MKRHDGFRWGAALAAAALLASDAASAAGFEKSVPFSGRYGGIVGAGAAVAEGPEALFFNPAALSVYGTPQFGESRARFSLNLSPTPSQHEGAMSNGALPLSADPKVAPMFAGFGSYSLSKRLAIGAGVYTSGGNNVVYDGIEVSPVFQRTELSARLQIVESSLGFGFHIFDGLEIGAAYRRANIAGDFSSFGFQTEGYMLSQIRYSGLRAERQGYRVGMRFAPQGANFGLGASYRSRMDFTAKGVLGGEMQALSGPLARNCAASPCSFQNVEGTLATSFPMQLNAGAFLDLSSSLRAVVEYSFTEYGRNDRIATTGVAALEDGTEIADMSATPIMLGWNHQRQGKLGFIYSGIPGWNLRAGYSLIGQVTPRQYASPTFAPPGKAHVVAFGAGLRLGPVSTDMAYEYSTSSGSGIAPNAGEFSVQAHALHAGVTLGL